MNHLPSNANDNISEKERKNVNIFSDEDQSNEYINQEIPVNINDMSEVRTKSNLSLDQERIIQKLPTFRSGNERIHERSYKQ